MPQAIWNLRAMWELVGSNGRAHSVETLVERRGEPILVLKIEPPPPSNQRDFFVEFAAPEDGGETRPSEREAMVPRGDWLRVASANASASILERFGGGPDGDMEQKYEDAPDGQEVELRFAPVMPTPVILTLAHAVALCPTPERPVLRRMVRRRSERPLVVVEVAGLPRDWRSLYVRTGGMFGPGVKAPLGSLVVFDTTDPEDGEALALRVIPNADPVEAPPEPAENPAVAVRAAYESAADAGPKRLGGALPSPGVRV